MSEAHWGSEGLSPAVEAAWEAENKVEKAYAYYIDAIENAEKAWAIVAIERRAFANPKGTTELKERL